MPAYITMGEVVEIEMADEAKINKRDGRGACWLLQFPSSPELVGVESVTESKAAKVGVICVDQPGLR